MKNIIGIYNEICPAKINLFLEVGKKRRDGFHDIYTVMHSVSLCDEITLEISSGNGCVDFTCTDPSLASDLSNIAYKAFELYRCTKDTMSFYDYKISVKKNIPVAAGLAGGSADAAGMLRVLNRIFGLYSLDDLLKMASTLGSDVPFCLIGGAAFAEGRGEKMTPLDALDGYYLIIGKNDANVSTAVAYAMVDDQGDYDICSYTDICTAFNEREYNKIWTLIFNRFENSVLPQLPNARKLKETLKAENALCAMMSGSGSSVFGVFENEKSAEDALSFVKEICPNAVIATFQNSLI